MSARLKRLEGMVRDMMDTEGGGSPSPKDNALDSAAAPMMQTKVVSSESTTNYLGATHCMAMLEDVSCDCCKMEGSSADDWHTD